MLRPIASTCTRRLVVSNHQRVPSIILGQESRPTTSAVVPMLPTTREFSSSSSTDAEGQQDVPFNRVYTHPLSQVVLEHLQNVHGEWLMSKGLDRGLTINRDGSFCIQFPANYPGDDSGRIWTSYDAAKKQHWLSVYKHELLGRYPLHQGEGEWACQMEKYMMRTTVDRMVERIAEADRKSEAGLVSS